MRHATVPHLHGAQRRCCRGTWTLSHDSSIHVASRVKMLPCNFETRNFSDSFLASDLLMRLGPMLFCLSRAVLTRLLVVCGGRICPSTAPRDSTSALRLIQRQQQTVIVSVAMIPWRQQIPPVQQVCCAARPSAAHQSTCVRCCLDV